MQSINPTTGALIKDYSADSNEQAAQKIADLNYGFERWRMTSFTKRAALVERVADILSANIEDYATLISREMGKVRQEAIAEINKCIWCCRYYAEHAESFLCDEPIMTESSTSFICYQPLGVVLAVMPWNFPFWQVFRFAAPAIMAGNVVALKHASNVTGCANAIQEIFCEAYGGANLFQALLVPGTQVHHLIAHDAVQAVTLTGSTDAGRAVAAEAGRHLKKTVLELGGSDPYLILADADIKAAAKICVTSRFINAGQSCIAAKRLIVEAPIYDEFVAEVVQLTKQLEVGDPLAADTNIGPMASILLRDELHQQVTETIKQGATLLLGGQIPAGAGAFYPPTVLVDVKPGMVAFDEELFGPVVAIVKAADDNHAIELANQSVFGLGGAVFSKDIVKATRIAKAHIDTGACFVNDFVKSDPRLPFGGIKQSGYGRELSYLGIREFTNIKTVVVK